MPARSLCSDKGMNVSSGPGSVRHVYTVNVSLLGYKQAGVGLYRRFPAALDVVDQAWTRALGTEDQA